MLILLSDEFQNRVRDILGAPGFSDAVRSLALGHHAGAHIVSGPFGVLTDLIGALSGDVRGISARRPMSTSPTATLTLWGGYRPPA